ncbi:hypothetical protein SGFS_022350 [Streptomyces graminofaciens]|uniref:Uncharacterized protein n=1 Tax=Streptomyces graminofaciens TaxID=68212 RepID=A0ABM7F4Z4_9ACTN|nr:hypothetical protein SGFS_022350 [Streptomyces graminofaciens]
MCEQLEAKRNVTIQISDVGNLPATLTTFVGRRRDLAEVRRRLGTARLLTLTGMGGVGKTRLALEVAAASAADFADGVWLVDLAPVRDPSLVANATATALGVPDLGTRPVIDQLVGHLRHRGPLMVGQLRAPRRRVRRAGTCAAVGLPRAAHSDDEPPGGGNLRRTCLRRTSAGAG